MQKDRCPELVHRKSQIFVTADMDAVGRPATGIPVGPIQGNAADLVDLLHKLAVQVHQESRLSLDPDIWCYRARFEVHSHNKGVGAVGAVASGAGVDAFTGLLLPFNVFEVDGGHRTDKLYGSGWHRVV